MTTPAARTLAKVLWDYHAIQQDVPSVVDLLLVLGSHDDRVAEYGAFLARTVTAELIVCSGGFGKITSATASEPEARRFRLIMELNGVPSATILTEEESTNTGENLRYTHALMNSLHRRVDTGVMVTKPHMKRRVLATAMKQWPEVSWTVTAPDMEFDKYPSDDVPERRMIELMVGDLQRVKLYGERGFQVPQVIPDDVWAAYHALVEMGYDDQLLRE